MTPGSFIASLRERGLSISATPSNRVRVRRADLTPEERAYLRANSEAVARALQALDALDCARRPQPSSLPGTQRGVLFRTRRGTLLLAELNVEEVRRLASSGRITADEVAAWDAEQYGRYMRRTPGTSAWDLVRRTR
jgi:hypothetical protein